MAVEISRQFGTSWETIGSAHPVVRHSLLPGVAVLECGTDGACGWNAVAVALQSHLTHAQPETFLAKADDLGKVLRISIKAHVVSE
eukprot:6587320-Alexandrium_andersonii.AAC.1